MKPLLLMIGLLAGLVMPACAEMVCGKDLDGDTFFDGTDELINCVNDVCPHDATDCTIGEPSCSDGATLNTTRDTCQMASVGLCPDGFTHDAELDKCLADPVCPNGGSYSSVVDMCVKTPLASCEFPYVLDAAGTLCVAPGECAEGVLNKTLGRCETDPVWNCPAGMTLTPDHQCAAPPACDAPSVYSPVTDRCQMPPVYECPVGYLWNGAFCEASAECGAGVLNTATDSCEIAPDGCPVGTSWDSALDQCIISASCNDPAATLNLATDRCEIPSTPSCAMGSSWDGSACISTPTCQSGIFEPVSGKCVVGEYACADGTTLAFASGQLCTSVPGCPANTVFDGMSSCTANLVCSSGTLFNATAGKCLATSPPTITCSSLDYGYNPVTGRCEKPPTCNAGVYDSTRDLCVAPASQPCSTPGYVYVNGRCEGVPVCGNGYVYNVASNTCVSTQPSCPTGYVYNPAQGRCTTEPLCSTGTYSATSNDCAYLLPVTFSGGSSFVQDTYYSGGIVGAGTTLNFMTCTEWGHESGLCDRSVVGSQVMVANTTLTGSVGSGPTTRITSAGNKIYFYTCVSADPESGACLTDGVSWTLTASGSVIFSGGGAITQSITGITGSGNTISFYYCSTRDSESGNCLATTPVVITASGGTTAHTTASCPGAGVLDVNNDKCWVAPSFSSHAAACSAGQLDFVKDVCFLPATPPCPTGMSPDGTGQCVASVTCTNGTLNTAANLCTQSTTTTCPSGTSWDGATCSVSASCPSGTVLSNGVCLATATCPGGALLADGQCVAPVNSTQNPPCPAGMTAPAPQLCVANPTCPADTSWDGTKCISPPVCPSGTTYSTATGTCLAVTPPTMTCPSFDFAYNTSSGSCEKSPSCPAGIFDPALDLCTASYTVPCSTPGYTYVNGRCEKTPACTIGFTYNFATNMCEKGSNYSYPATNSATMCKVETTPGGTYASFILKTSGIEAFRTTTPPGTTVYGTWTDMNYCNKGTTGADGVRYRFTFDSQCNITYVLKEYSSCYLVLTITDPYMPGVFPMPPGTTGTYFSNISPLALTCPNGGTLVGNQCVVNTFEQQPPDCASLDFARDVCFQPAMPPCPAGLVYNAAFGLCTVAPGCTGGTLDPTANLCTQIPTIVCPTNTAWDGNACSASAGCASGAVLNNGVCQAAGVCPPGTTLTDGICSSSLSCPAGSTLAADNKCVIDPLCASGATLVNGTCQQAASPECPANYNVDGTVCHQPPFCQTGTYAAAADTCFAGGNPCPAGYTINKVADVCSKVPLCPAGGGYDALVSNTCKAEVAYTCQVPGFSYDSGNGSCWDLADCGQANLNAELDVCQVSATPDCAAKSWDPIEEVCHTLATCSQAGIYSLANQQCEVAPGADCGDWVLNATNKQCEESPLCPEPPNYPLANSIGFDAGMDKCTATAMHEDCLPGYMYQPLPVGMCEKPITCSQGVYDPVTDTCPSIWNCPLGSQYACADIGSGSPQCSPFACADPSTDTTPEESADTLAYTDDGTVDENGQCNGLWMLFNGKGQECLPPGWKTSFFDCCDSDEDSFLFIKKVCNEEAYEVALARDAGRTHYVGSYCKKKVFLIGCVQRAKVFCVFNSKMGRIIQEGCRPQLKDFGPSGGWGSAKSPNCVGLTPEQFQSCDFGKIDFSEMQSDFAPNLNNVAPSVQGAIDGYMQNLR